MQKIYHYIYKITRFDGMYYIGMHSTDNLDDGYFGSGKRLWHSINYHGKDKHTKEILEFLPDRESLKLREKELVCKELLEDKMCMNIAIGGDGTWHHVNSTGRNVYGNNGKPGFGGENFSSPENRSKAAKTRWQLHRETYLNASKKGLSKAIIAANSESAKEKRKETWKKNNFQQKENNSQWGKKWMNNGKENKSVKADEVTHYLNNGFSFGRIKKEKPIKILKTKSATDVNLLKEKVRPFLERYLNGESLRSLAVEYGKSHVSLRKDLKLCFNECLNSVKQGSLKRSL